MQRMGLSREDNDGTAGGGEDTSSSNGGDTPLRVETRSVFNIKLGIFGMVKMVKKASPSLQYQACWLFLDVGFEFTQP